MKPTPDFTTEEFLHQLAEVMPKFSGNGMTTPEIANEFNVGRSSALKRMKSMLERGEVSRGYLKRTNIDDIEVTLRGWFLTPGVMETLKEKRDGSARSFEDVSDQ